MCNKKLNRRNFIQIGLSGAATTPLWLPSRKIFAASGEPEFMLHIHLGSWCGLSSGMVQPQKPGEWPNGAHVRGSNAASNNPNMNKHFGIGNFVFHDYSKALAEHHEQIMMATISSVALGHPEAKGYQQSGNLPNASGAGWLAAFSDVVKGSVDKKLIIANAQASAKPNSFTPNQVTMSGNSVDGFNRASKDGVAVPQDGENSKLFWEAYKSRFSSSELDLLQRMTNDTEKSDINYTLKTLNNGFAGYNTNDTDYKDLAAALNKNDLIAKLGDVSEGANNILRNGSLLNDNTFRDQLILAGMLAKKTTATGMSIDIGGGDFHAGGSDVTTANSAAKLWTQLMQFWSWVKANNLDDKILVMVTHEFGRTPYNGTSRRMSVLNDGKTVEVDAQGRDHSLLTGMFFLNRNVPNGRVGGMGVGHTPLGSDNLKGIANANIEGYTSANVMGSLFMRLFGDKIKGDDRKLREYWNNFNSHIPTILG
jgi:hypothetical protein